MILKSFELVQSMRTVLWLFVLNSFLIKYVICTPPIQLYLKTSWEKSSYSLELLELTKYFNKTSSYQLIDHLLQYNENEEPLDKINEQQLHDIVLKINLDNGLINRDAEQLFLVLEALRFTTTRVEAINSFFKETVQVEVGKLSENKRLDVNCEPFIQVGKQIFCSLEKFEKHLKEEPLLKDDNLVSSKIQSFDAIHPSFKGVVTKSDKIPVAILYIQTIDSNMIPFHKKLRQLAEQGNIQYILRYFSSEREEKGLRENGIYLSGFGATLELKNTEYKSMDDRRMDLNDDNFQLNNNLNSEYVNYNNDLVKQLHFEPYQSNLLHEDNFTSLNYKTTQFILDSEFPISTWSYLVQNFPKHALQMVKQDLRSGACAGITFQRDWFRVTPAPNTLLVNGVALPLSELDIFKLFELINIERETINQLIQLGFQLEEAVQYLKLGEFNFNDEAKEEFDLFDVRSINIEGEDLIFWLNDLEKDELYKDFDKDIQSLLGTMYGGYLPEVQKNYANVIFNLDLTNVESIETLAVEILPLIKGKVPIRFGFIILLDKKELKLDNEDYTSREKLFHQFYQIRKELGSKGIIEAIDLIHNLIDKDNLSIIKVMDQVINKLGIKDLNEENKEEKDKFTQSLYSYIHRLNLNLLDPTFFVNGKRLSFDNNYQRALITTLGQQISFIKEKIQNQDITNETDIFDYLLDQPNVFKKYNSLLLDPLELGEQKKAFINFDNELNLNWNYFVGDNDNDNNKNEEENIKSLITLLLIDDFNTENGIKLGKKALEYLQTNNQVRLGFIHQPKTLQMNQTLGFTTLLYKALNQLDVQPSIKELLNEMNKEEFNNLKGISEEETLFWQGLQLKLNHWDPELPSGANVIVGGKVFKLFKDSDYLDLEFNFLVEYELKTRLQPIINSLKDLKFYKELNNEQRSNILMRTASILGLNLQKHHKLARFESKPGKRKRLPHFEAKECELNFGDLSKAWVHINFILNPLSVEGQRWSSILESLTHLDGLYISGHLNPNNKVDELKRLSKRFYRFVNPLKPNFDSKGVLIKPYVQFSQLPKDTLFTAGLITVSSWLTAPTYSPYDLDNLILNENLPSVIESEFTLQHLLIEGHMTDVTTQSSPRGLELYLSTAKRKNIVDTIVMANLGYFQLKANPGCFNLKIREGRSSELYSFIENMDNNICLTSFGGKILFPKVIKNSGMETQSLIIEEEIKNKENEAEKKGFFDNWFTKKEDSKEKEKDKNQLNSLNTIHIFSVASGHLYERFLSVMILSVLKNTKNPTKFWFIENFLSPSFKSFIPKMANKYGFDYELITYQWPHWLNSQTEKQRIIWGYKILFLDVLFPLNVDKVIFVDADQVVRADLKELIEMDLKGAPYGYVPFCNSRESMKGYRFWEQGYWKDHLGDKPYHISALYVVDLKKFRQLAAGDQLRGHYQMLSYDPNSLANLDQDLPNHLQPKLPIFSLPIEWLWCETWCDDQSLKKAKTIDLCNNPETKEPKLDRAKRILPEWQDLDNEIGLLRDETLNQMNSSTKDQLNQKKDFIVNNKLDSSKGSKDSFEDVKATLKPKQFDSDESFEENDEL